MKTRHGLVSNSSSSSFIVHWLDRWFTSDGSTKYLISDEEKKLLLNNGYRTDSSSHPSHLNYDGIECPVADEDELSRVSLAKTVSCNQDDEIYFLLKNKIPFTASVHYGHQTWIYPRDSEYLYRFMNHGLEVETYNQGDTSLELDEVMKGQTEGNERFLISEWLAKEEKMQVIFKELEKDEDTTRVSQ